jgi:solute carrier family 25 phosphate transporter 3
MALTLLPLVLTSTTAAEPLEELELSLGDAKWNDATATVSRSASIPLSARIVPPSFATYLARFLLSYDDAAFQWWQKQSDSFSLLPSNEAKKRESKSFSSYASSIQKGLYSYVSGENESNISSYFKVRTQYSSLLTSLLDKYGGKEGAIRDIGLLFAMLPSVYQPSEQLLKLDKEIINKMGTNKGSRSDNFPPNFQEDFTLLLPNKYHILYNDIDHSYAIAPKINLFEIEVNEEPGVTAISTTFGPLSSKPLLRERSFSLNIYALLGISGGAGCALTHTLVIPLDVVKTRMQTNPGEYDGVFDGAATIVREEGVGALLLGAQATIVGYLWYGISVYPSYAFFKRFIASSLLSPAFAVAHSK